jgi:hypothetical protein
MELTVREPGEYTIGPVTNKAFESWVKTVEDSRIPVQYSDEKLTWVVMSKPHDGIAGTAAAEFIRAVQKKMPLIEQLNVNLCWHTGCKSLSRMC